MSGIATVTKGGRVLRTVNSLTTNLYSSANQTDLISVTHLQTISLRITEYQMLMFYWLKGCHHHGGQCLL